MYREHPPPRTLSALVACTWEHQLAHDQAAQIVPDACIDLVWTGRYVRVAGPDTRPVCEDLSAGTSFVGLRFRPGMASAVLGLPASALRDARVDLHEIWGDAARRLDEALAGAPADVARAQLAEAVHVRAAGTRPDPLIATLVARLQARSSDPTLRIAALTRELGLGERQLHRRCTEAVGYGPKLLARILRLHAFRDALHAEPRDSLAALAAQLGYTDQAHLTHDARALFGSSPARMREQALATA